MEDPEASGSIRQLDLAPIDQDDMGYHAPPKVSGSENLLDFAPMEQGHEQSQPRRNNHEKVPHRRFKIEGESFIIAYDEEEQKTIEQTLSGPTFKEWIKDMEEEINSMKSNKVWDFVDLPPGRKNIENKWVLGIKSKANETIDIYKSRLVVKGYTQQKGIDYGEAFSPVVRFASVRLILALVARMDLELYQMDIKLAFLNGELDEEIYMDQPASSLEDKSVKFASSKDSSMVLNKP